MGRSTGRFAFLPLKIGGVEPLPLHIARNQLPGANPGLWGDYISWLVWEQLRVSQMSWKRWWDEGSLGSLLRMLPLQSEP